MTGNQVIARSIHFLVMVSFVLFFIGHMPLIALTGFAASDGVRPVADGDIAFSSGWCSTARLRGSPVTPVRRRATKVLWCLMSARAGSTGHLEVTRGQAPRLTVCLRQPGVTGLLGYKRGPAAFFGDDQTDSRRDALV